MTDIVIYISGLVFLVITIFMLWFSISSIYEKEKRASIVSGIIVVIIVIKFIAFAELYTIGFFDSGIGLILLAVGLLILFKLVLLLIIPMGANPDALKGTKGLVTGKVARFDERQTVFSKLTAQLMEEKKNGPVTMSVMPEMGRIDGESGKLNVLMGEAASDFARSIARPVLLYPKVAPETIEITSRDASKQVKEYAKQLGAELVGITEINPDWIYSHYGRSGVATDEWGSEISNQYKYAIVFATEMKIDNIRTAPHTPVMLESLLNYAKGAFIATNLAKFIADMGYPAKVNQMAHYDTPIVTLAIDAGLGELSRMGYLITKEYGPRVRLAAVLTNLPLDTDKPVDIGVVDFCRKCKKCSVNCPSGSISTGDRTEENGSLRWIIDRESCFKYWHHVGTDCCICMRVCPYSHARTFPHQVITWLVTRNSFARTIFTIMDDIFYGKKPVRIE